MLFGIFDYLQKKVWRKAYILLCAWFAFSFSLAIAVSYFTTSPYISTIYNGISLYLILCLFINIIWWWCRFVGRFNMPILVISHIFGFAFWYILMGTVWLMASANSFASCPIRKLALQRCNRAVARGSPTRR